MPIPPDDGQATEWFRWAVGGVLGFITVGIGWIQLQINQLRRDNQNNRDDLRRELVEMLSSMREANEIQHGALKEDIKELRDNIEKNRDEAALERRRMIDTLGVMIAKQAALPDRAEMQSAISSMRVDMATLIRTIQNEHHTG